MNLKNITSTEPKTVNYKEQEKHKKSLNFYEQPREFKKFEEQPTRTLKFMMSNQKFLEKVTSNQPEIWNSKEQTKEFEKI